MGVDILCELGFSHATVALSLKIRVFLDVMYAVG